MPVANPSVYCYIHKLHAMPFGMLLSSVLLLPLTAIAHTIHGDKEVFAHVHSDGVAEVADAVIKRHKLLRKEAKLYGASLIAEGGRITSRTRRTRYLPQYPTGPATCDGSQCPSDKSVDPCSQLQNCSIGGHHDCEGTFKMCIPDKDSPTKCATSEVCLLRCTGVFVEEKSDGSKGAPACSDLSPQKCDGHYVADKDYTSNGLGYECVLKEDQTCGTSSTCGVQNPPESLGEKQCYEPEVFKGSPDGTCSTLRTRPGHECKTQCAPGYTPSLAALKCKDIGEFEPKTFECEPNACKVKPVQNALASGCKEGPNAGEAVIVSGEKCTVQCKDGFYASDELLRCHAEVLTPAAFTCEAPCPVPTVKNAAAAGVCKEAGVGDKILPFTSCTSQCAPGYTPSVQSLSCRTGAFTPQSVTCEPDPCEAPSGVEFVSKEGACKEGATLSSGSSCTAQCLAGYTPSAATLSCNAKTLAPATFTCAANPCKLPSVEQSKGNGCKGVAGDTIESGKACRTVCNAGYTPSVDHLDCLAETLTPATFVCKPDPCPIPFDKNQEDSGCVGVAAKNGATSVESSQKCQTQCKAGWHPSVAQLSCFAGTLTPDSWSCDEDPCSAPTKVSNAPELTCRQGSSIVSGTGCTTLCNEGYSPSAKALACHLGKFTPATYVCQPDPCPVHEVSNRLGSGCESKPHPAIIPSGSSCRTQCQEGYSPSVVEQKCFAATMTPTFWTCDEDPCDAPGGIRNSAEETCKEGKSVSAGQLCTAQCASGFSPSVASLGCSLGKLSPSTFSCVPDPCKIPEVANKQGNGCKGLRGNTVKAGTSCIPVCKSGFQPSETSLQCTASQLSPATWVCEPEPCSALQVERAWGTGCNGGMKSKVDSGSACEIKCQDGYAPSVPKLNCYASMFTPSSYTCDPKPCRIPAVQNKAGSGCLGAPGDSIASGTKCTTQCLGGYTPSVAELTCSAEMLTPATFECSADPCPMPKATDRKGNGCKGMPGTVVASGATCETECSNGYTPSVAKLECFAGTLSPNSYICAQDDCAAVTGVPNAPTVACQEGATIPGGKTCTPRCNAGYSPSKTSLACRRGELEPSSFECKADSCDVPYVANSLNPTCAEGNSVDHGKRCTPKCKSGYSASESSLSCSAGTLSPATFLCKAPCAAPNVLHSNGVCKEGSSIEHGKSCTTQCNAGYMPNKASLECNDGSLTGLPVFCQTGPPPIGGDFYNCWTGDPHFTCHGGRRSDPLVPGTHWVFKQSCPGSPNFMWVQGLYGPRSPSVTMGAAFGGLFLSKNVLTIRVNNNPSWVVKWNDQPIANVWQGSGSSWNYNLGGTQLSITWTSSKIEVGLSYGVTYKASRSGWNRENNIKVSGFYYTDYYTQNNFWCKDGTFAGEAIELPHPRNVWSPSGDDKLVNSDYDLFQKSKAHIEAKLDSLTAMASLLDTDDVEDGIETLALNQSLKVSDEPQLCTGKALEEAQKDCAVLKKEETEEEQEELEEDEEAQATQEATYNACIADVCATANGNFGEAAKETEEESEMQAALKHKKAFRTAAADGECKEGWTSTDSGDNFLLEEEKSRADKKKEACTVACKICRPAHRRYLVGPMVLHNETKDACIAQELAMPKAEADKARLWILQKKFTTAEKGWIGGNFKEGGWKWGDDTDVEGGGTIEGKVGDYLCLDKENGKLINCDHRPDVRHDALCETMFY
ncbi:unnamed protein product [Effrenium voratum]|nr:unnamed protein product [Effrenium voratum]